jgi:hypothetical protein
VTSFEVDLQRKKVVVTGDVTPLEVLQSVSKVKLAQLWMPLSYANQPTSQLITPP